MKIDFKTFRSQEIRLTLIGSLILSGLYTCLTPFINRDGIFYIELAEKIHEHTQSHLAAVHHWHFYSMLINTLNQFIPFSYLTTAHIINAIATALLLAVWLLLTNRLTLRSSHHLWIAAGLFLCFPGLNETRAEILREPCAWLFISLSMMFFLNYLEKNRQTDFYIWFAHILIASLFRIEYLAYLILVPFFLIMFDCFLVKRKLQLMKRHIAFILLILLVTLLCIAAYQFSAKQIGRLSELPQAFSLLNHYWQENIAKLDLILPKQTQKHANLFLFSGFSSIYFYTFIHQLSIPIAITALFIFKDQKNQTIFRNQACRLTWYSYTLSAMAVPYYIMLKNAILPGRFFIFLSALCFMPFSYLISVYLSKVQLGKIQKITILFLALVMLALNIDLPSKKHQALKESIAFIKKESPTCLVSNNNQLSFYSGFSTTKPDFFALLYENNYDGLTIVRKKFKRFLNKPLCTKTIAAIKYQNLRELSYLSNYLNSAPVKTFNYKANNGYAIYVLTPFNEF